MSLTLIWLLCALLPSALSGAVIRPLKADLPAQDEIRMHGVTQDSNGIIRHLRGAADVETTEMKISADEIDFNSDTDWAYARGHVHMDYYATGDKINAERAEYNLRTDEGRFWNLNGTAPAKIMTNPFALTTTNPFYFQAMWADRIKNRYILHKGFITDCKIPKPWWIFQAPVFNIIPGDRAIARNSVFRLHNVPIFFLPFYYRPLGKNPRQSGFLMPTIGHSSFYGYVYGEGYYWAVNPSYDMTGVVEYFTQRGPAISYDFRGKPNDVTDFNFTAYDVEDRGVAVAHNPDLIQKQGGRQFQLTARTEIAGFTGRLSYNYLSSLLFREAFSYNFTTAIYNGVDSIGYLQRRFKHGIYTLNLVGQRNELFEAATGPSQLPNEVILRKLPSVEFGGRDQQIAGGSNLPVWLSFASSASLLDRSEPIAGYVAAKSDVFHSNPYSRVDLEPHVQTSFHVAGFSFQPGISLDVTDYSNSYKVNSTTYTAVSSAPKQPGCGGYPSCPPISAVTQSLANSNLLRKDADFTFDMRTPPLEKVFTPPKWLRLGGKVKHVIEGEAKYEYVTGIDDFRNIIHFDEIDLRSNTNQLTLSVTNRLYRKDKAGNVAEFLTWRVSQARYFDPTFGGAVVSEVSTAFVPRLGKVVVNGFRNVVLPTEELTQFTFLDGPRNYSPIISVLTLVPSPFMSVEWRTEYDPLEHKFTDQTLNTTVRHGKVFGSISENSISTDPLLVPQNNQIGFGGGYGSTNRKGWNIAGTLTRDLLLSRTLFEFVQASYNTDCCGFNFQLRRINFGIRDDNQYLFSFSLANLGTFGSLQRQERIF